LRTEKKAIRVASRYMGEWIASDIILMEHIAYPTTNFIKTRPVLDMTEILAVFFLRWESALVSTGENYMGFVTCLSVSDIFKAFCLFWPGNGATL